MGFRICFAVEIDITQKFWTKRVEKLALLGTKRLSVFKENNEWETKVTFYKNYLFIIKYKVMKIKIVAICLFTVIRTTSAFAGDSINLPEKVAELFKHSFPQVENVVWYKVDNSYEAYFKESDQTICKVFYTKRGKLLYTFKYSSGEDIPLFIKNILAEKYKDKKILNTTEVYANNSTNFYIILGNQNSLSKIKVNVNGDILEDESFVNGG